MTAEAERDVGGRLRRDPVVARIIAGEVAQHRPRTDPEPGTELVHRRLQIPDDEAQLDDAVHGLSEAEEHGVASSSQNGQPPMMTRSSGGMGSRLTWTSIQAGRRPASALLRAAASSASS